MLCFAGIVAYLLDFSKNSKYDLIAATVESVWYDIFHFPENKEMFDTLISCVKWTFDSLRKGDEKYPGFFTMHSVSFIGEEKSDGQQRMAQSWIHIKEVLSTALANDPNVRPDAFDDSFTQRDFTEILFSLIISALLQHNYDCSGILGLIRRVIYL